MSIIVKPRLSLNYIRKGQQNKQNVQRLGDPKKPDILRNCLTCSRWPVCKDSKKSANYACTRFRESTMDASLESIYSTFDPMAVADYKQPRLSEDEIREQEAKVKGSEDEDSIMDMIANVINSNVPVPPDLRLDDRDIPEAANFYQWITDDRFGKVGNPPFPRQVEFGLKLNSEWCPRCSDADWFDDFKVDTPIITIRDHVQLLKHGKCPRCKATKSEMILSDELPCYFGLTALIGQRASKTSSCILWDQYDLHKMLKLPSPQGVFGVQDTQLLVSTYTALTFAQAVENIWVNYLSALKTNPWFKTYHKFLDDASERLGEELYNVGEHMVRYRHRNLALSPSGPSKRVMRGRTRRSAITDEIGQFPVAKKGGKIGEELERLDAQGVFDALNNSIFTLKAAYRVRLEEGYNNLPKPMMYMPSSPSQYNDFIMTAYRTYQGSREFYSVKMATWEYNPKLKREHFKEQFRTKPVESARDYECNPPIGESLFINDVPAMSKSFTHGINKIKVDTKKKRNSVGKLMTYSEATITSNSMPERGTVLAVDIGIVNNSLSFAIVGPPDDFDADMLPEDRDSMQTPVRVWAVGEIIPMAGTRISLTAAYAQCFVPLLESFNVKYFVSDRWNNAKIAQDLESTYDITSIEHRCKWEDFDTTRDLLYSGNLQLPKPITPIDEILATTMDNYPEVFRGRAIDHLVWQFATVREQTNVTVLKSDYGTDDSFRTVVLGVAMVQDPEIGEELLEFRGANKTPPKAFVGMVRKLSAGGVAGQGHASSANAGTIGIVRRMGR